MKSLEALKYLKENKRRHWLDNDNSNECLNIIEKSLKVLDIFKCLNEDSFEIIPENPNWIKLKTNIYMPIEKYNLLKEVLTNE